MMQGTIQTLHAKCGFGFRRDSEGADLCFHRSALTPPERFATLEVGMPAECEPESSPQGSAPRRSPSRLGRRLRCDRFKSWQAPSTDMLPAQSVT